MAPVILVASEKASPVPLVCVEVIVCDGALLVKTVPPEVLGRVKVVESVPFNEIVLLTVNVLLAAMLRVLPPLLVTAKPFTF